MPLGWGVSGRQRPCGGKAEPVVGLLEGWAWAGPEGLHVTGGKVGFYCQLAGGLLREVLNRKWRFLFRNPSLLMLWQEQILDGRVDREAEGRCCVPAGTEEAG